jgi:hypothetical protein
MTEEKLTNLEVALDMSNGKAPNIHELEDELWSSFCSQQRTHQQEHVIPMHEAGDERKARCHGHGCA